MTLVLPMLGRKDGEEEGRGEVGEKESRRRLGEEALSVVRCSLTKEDFLCSTRTL